MPETRIQNSDFNRAFGDAKKQAANVAGEVQDAAGDICGQARDSASSVADATKRRRGKPLGSFEKALRNTVETAALYGRGHRAWFRLAVRPHAPAAVIAVFKRPGGLSPVRRRLDRGPRLAIVSPVLLAEEQQKQKDAGDSI